MPELHQHLHCLHHWAHQAVAQGQAACAGLWENAAVLSALNALAEAADARENPGPGIQALFAGWVEWLNDRLSPAYRALYSCTFAQIIAHCAQRCPQLGQALAQLGLPDGRALWQRHHRLRTLRPWPNHARRVLLPSRVTVGADVLLLSVLIQRLRQAYPQAEILIAGDAKLSGLFAGCPGLRVLPVRYTRRGPLGERLHSWITLRQEIAAQNPDLVISADSRIDQLGLLPLVSDAQYYLWENTQPDPQKPQALASLLDAWCRASCPSLPAAPCTPRVWLDQASQAQAQQLTAALGKGPWCAVKLDHGGNPDKALPRSHEVAILKHLQQQGWRILLDRGFGEAELAASDSLLGEAGLSACDIDDSSQGRGRPIHSLAANSIAQETMVRFHGSIGGWAGGVSACRLALSYDSVGQHLAAALGIPVVVPFTGFHDPAFPIAWSPVSSAPVHCLRIALEERQSPASLQAVLAALPAAT